MELKNRLLNLRNKIDFQLRSAIQIKRPLRTDAPIPGMDHKVQKEFQDFLNRFSWEYLFARFSKDTLVAADVGARNFCFAPVLDALFRDHSMELELHGIEIDSFRRLKDLHTRYDYGIFYSKQCRHAAFHPVDFLKFKTPLDICFLLNPFVSDEPTLHWGLPLSVLKPQPFFDHAFALLRDETSIAVLSCPSPEEYEIACRLAKASGFSLGEEVLWKPKEGSQQQKPRYGLILHKERSK